jgi:hypothetical protein
MTYRDVPGTGLIDSAGLGAADLRILCQTLPGLIRI